MKLIRLFPLSVILIFLLAACAGAPAATEAPLVTEFPAATEAPFVTEAPATLEPTEEPFVTEAPATELPTEVSPPLAPTSEALSLDEQMAQIDAVLRQTLDASIAYNKPESMTLDQTVTIELLLNPSQSPEVLSTQVTEPGQVASTSLQITPRMKAVLLSLDPDAFIIKEIHSGAEQVVSSVDTTTWHWLVTAKKEGSQTLELVIYQLVKYEEVELWHEVETYKTNIVVKVTVSSWIKSLDWKWIVETILVLAASVIAFLSWWSNRKKKMMKKRSP